MGVKSVIGKVHAGRYERFLQGRVEAIRDLQAEFASLSDDGLREVFAVLRSVPVEDRVEQVYALVAVVAERVLGLCPFDVQLQGALALADGKLCNINTGEGKTLVSCFPVVLHAMDGQVHVVTTNEYLASRDAGFLAPVYEFFGLSVAMNFQADSRVLKREHYSRDVVYGVASTFGFDYLADNMVQRFEDKVCVRGRFFAVIDEADLILIDEARTPLIIGAPCESNKDLIRFVDSCVKQLVVGEDFSVDVKNKSVVLSRSGDERLAGLLKVEGSLYAEEHIGLSHLVYQSLVANFVYQCDVDYALSKRDGVWCVDIIDGFTGRIQPDRRFSQGLHQALEAKHSECVVKDESCTVATVTLQNYFRMYDGLCGMSGTVVEEADEFMEVYGLECVVIKPNRPLRRDDMPARLFASKAEKWDAVLDCVLGYHGRGFPVLVGTVSVEDSEELSARFRDVGLEHEVLNAKQDVDEAEVIRGAGRIGSVMIATNMAGRGTDIKPESAEHPLVVVQTELNESSRVDNQLKGRTSRQGAWGITEVFLSAEDSIFERTSQARNLGRVCEGAGVSSRYVYRLFRSVQREFEGASSQARRSALRYDDVIREQRDKFYSARDRVLLLGSLDDCGVVLGRLGLLDDFGAAFADCGVSEPVRVGLVRDVLLFALDKAWVEHIDRLECLKSIIGWRGQTGHNPVIVYQNEAQVLYDGFVDRVREFALVRLEGVLGSGLDASGLESVFLK